jgi:hypothetical protein
MNVYRHGNLTALLVRSYILRGVGWDHYTTCYPSYFGQNLHRIVHHRQCFMVGPQILRSDNDHASIGADQECEFPSAGSPVASES